MDRSMEEFYFESVCKVVVVKDSGWVVRGMVLFKYQRSFLVAFFFGQSPSVTHNR